MSLTGYKFAGCLLGFQIFFIVLFALFVDYDESANAANWKNSRDHDKGGADHENNQVKHYYPMFTDVHVMIFFGFGFLMLFLRRYGYGSVSFSLLIGAFVVQWSILISGFLHMHHGKITINITNMLTADFAAAAVLISFGAVLGKVGPLQITIMSFLEIVFFSINEWIGVEHFKAVDIGGSMFVHTFGAYFGLAVTRVLYRKEIHDSENEASVYHSDLFSMAGTLFLWMMWPSFNAALAPGDDQHRAVINTYLALAACALVTFAISVLVNKEKKLDMVHMQNATLAGGVAVGTMADMMIRPWGALVVGTVAAVISTVGFKFLTPFLATKLKTHDTCGVNNLHGMPGVMAGIGGIIAAAVANTDAYGTSLYQVFPARAPLDNTTALHELQANFSAIEPGVGRSAGQQAGYQAAALGVTIIFALVSGVITGIVLRLPLWDQPKQRHYFDDTPYWEVPDDFGNSHVIGINGEERKEVLMREMERRDV